MKKKNKRGFTLVELLVVIAILAILATVTVVGYISFTNKAKESNDISLTTQMNTVLQAEEATEGKADTLSTAIEWLKEAGLDAEKLTPTSDGYKYIWDKETNRFYLLNDKGEVVSPEDGEITSGIEIVHNNEQLNASNYGVYLASDYEGDVNSISNKSVELAAGLNVESLSVSSDKDIYIAGDIKELTINAPTASINYYGNSNSVEASVADNSLHIYGEVLTVILKQGRVVAEANSIINTVDTTKATQAVKVEVSNNGNIGAIIKGSQEVNTNESIKDIVVEHTAEMDLFAGGVGSEASPYLIANQNNLLNIGNTSLDETYYKLIDDIVLLESLTINTDNILYLDLNKNKITYSFDLNRANDSDYEGAIINLQGNTKLYIDGDGNMTFDNNYIADNANSIGYTFRLTNNASIIINSGDFYCGLTCVQLDQTSSCEINGGTFEAMLPYDNRFWILNKIDNSNSTFYVKGGTFINYDPSNSETENPDDNFLAEGYQVEKISLSSGLFQVVVKQL